MTELIPVSRSSSAALLARLGLAAAAVRQG